MIIIKILVHEFRIVDFYRHRIKNVMSFVNIFCSDSMGLDV